MTDDVHVHTPTLAQMRSRFARDITAPGGFNSDWAAEFDRGIAAHLEAVASELDVQAPDDGAPMPDDFLRGMDYGADQVAAQIRARARTAGAGTRATGQALDAAVGAINGAITRSALRVGVHTMAEQTLYTQVLYEAARGAFAAFEQAQLEITEQARGQMARDMAFALTGQDWDEVPAHAYEAADRLIARGYRPATRAQPAEPECWCSDSAQEYGLTDLGCPRHQPAGRGQER